MANVNPTVYTGVAPHNIVPALPDNLADSFSGAMIHLQPNGAIPLFYLLDSIETETAKSTLHQFNSMRDVYPTAKVTAAAPATAAGATTTLELDNTNGFIENMMLTNWTTNEALFITKVVDATHVEVMRQMSATPSVAMVAGDGIVYASEAFEESSLRPTPRHHTSDKEQNITMIIRTSWGVSGTARAVLAKEGDGAVATSQKQGGFWHSQAIERALWLSQLSEGTYKGQPFRTMQGFRQGMLDSAPTNVVQANATTSYDEFNRMIEPVFSEQVEGALSFDRVAIGDNVSKRVFNQMGRKFGNLQVTTGSTSFGTRFNQVETDTGTVTFLESALFNRIPEMSGTMTILNLDTLRIAYLGEGDNQRKTQHQLYNISGSGKLTEMASDDGVDAVGGTFTTELTLVNKHPTANMIIHGLTEGV